MINISLKKDKKIYFASDQHFGLPNATESKIRETKRNDNGRTVFTRKTVRPSCFLSFCCLFCLRNDATSCHVAEKRYKYRHFVVYLHRQTKRRQTNSRLVG